jgi:DNA-binding beta-propeller fold protein YncE
MPPIIIVMNAKTGATVATITDIGGADMVAYSAKNNQYYIGGSNMPGGGTLGVIDATTNKLVQKLALPGGITPHSLAVDDNTGHVFVPSNAEGGGCNCIQVLALQ